MLTPSATFDLRSQARLVALSVHACLVSAGLLPWVLAIGYVTVAAAQEPLLLRSYGIHLVPQTVQCVGGVVVLVICSQLRIVRRPITHVLTTMALTTLVAFVLVACMLGIEFARRGQFPASAGLVAAPELVVNYFPVALCMSFAGRGQSLVQNAHVVVQAIFAGATSVRASDHNWSFGQGVATMACSASAVAAAFYYCKQKS